MKMLSKLLARLGSAELDPEGEKVSSERWSVSGVRELLRDFPVGARVLYSPEFKKELRLESILLACSINHHFVYSQNHVGPWSEGKEAGLLLTEEEGDCVIQEVSSFYLVIPFQTRSEIDYRPQERRDPGARMVENTVNDFERGNYITLISFTPYGRVPHLDTTVKSITTLTKGYYAGNRVVILDPFPNTLSYRDKRKHQRLCTHIPAQLRLSPEAWATDCVLHDFSERFVRIILDPDAPILSEMVGGRRVFVTIDPRGDGRLLSLQGAVFRANRGAVVVELKAILKEGKMAVFQLIDELHLKATLLDHPETQKLLRKAKSSD